MCIECCSRLVTSIARKTETLKDCEKRCVTVLPEVINLCGDVHLMLAKESISSLQRHKAEMQRPVYRDETIAIKAWKLIGDENRELNYSWCIAISDSIEENLEISFRCYETALKEINVRAKNNGSELELNNENLREYVVNAVDLSRRLGNNRNELGVYYMNLAHTMFNAHDETEDEEKVEKNVEGSEKSLNFSNLWISHVFFFIRHNNYVTDEGKMFE